MGRLFSFLSTFVVVIFTVLRPEDLPDAWNPLTPLDLDAPPNFVSRWKVRMGIGDGALCRAALGRTSVRADALADHEASDLCHIRSHVRLAALSKARMRPMSTTCEMAARLYLWEVHDLQPAARRILGSAVARIEHYDSFSCRRIRTVAGVLERMSQHATANAVDISGFVLEDGRRISVRTGWTGDGAEARFLRAAQDGLCRWFNMVLGPDYNSLHADHFHADMGRWPGCR